MTTDGSDAMTCDEFRDLASDYIEGSLERDVRARAESHSFDCAACSALVADLRRLAAHARALPALSPSRDLWEGIESRIQAEVVELQAEAGSRAPGAGSPKPDVGAGFEVRTWLRGAARWRAAAAATLLVGVTSGITWFATVRATSSSIALVPDSSASGFRPPTSGGASATFIARPGLVETYDAEIAALRRLVDQRRAELDPVTLGVLERNLKVIDQAIAESRAALAESPSSALLMQQLTDAYDTKLRVLRAVATMPLRG
jgi:hypothetical protein